MILWLSILTLMVASVKGDRNTNKMLLASRSPPMVQSQVNPLLASILAAKSDPALGQPPCPFNCPSPCPYPCNNQAQGAGMGMGIGSMAAGVVSGMQNPLSCPQQCSGTCPAGCPGGAQASMQPIQSNCPQNCCPQGCPQTQGSFLPQMPSFYQSFMGAGQPPMQMGCPPSCMGFGAQQQVGNACPPGCPSSGFFPQAASYYPQAIGMSAYQLRPPCPPSCNPSCPTSCQPQGLAGVSQAAASCPQNCCPQGCQGTSGMQTQPMLQNMLRMMASLAPPPMTVGCPQQCLTGAMPQPSFCPPACNFGLRAGLVRQMVPSLCPQACTGTCPAGCPGAMMTGFMQMPAPSGCPQNCCPVGCPQTPSSQQMFQASGVSGCPSQCSDSSQQAPPGCPANCPPSVFELAKKIAGSGIAQPSSPSSSQSGQSACPNKCSGTCPSGCGQQDQQQQQNAAQSTCPQNCCPQGCTQGQATDQTGAQTQSSAQSQSDALNRFLKFLASFTPPKLSPQQMAGGTLPPELAGGCPNPCPHPCPPGCIPSDSASPYQGGYSMMSQPSPYSYMYQQPQYQSYGGYYPSSQYSPYAQSPCPSYCPTPQSCPPGCSSGFGVSSIGFSAQYLPQPQSYAGITPCASGYGAYGCSPQQSYGMQQYYPSMSYGMGPQAYSGYQQQSPCSSAYDCGLQQQQLAYNAMGYQSAGYGSSGCGTPGCGMSAQLQQPQYPLSSLSMPPNLAQGSAQTMLPSQQSLLNTPGSVYGSLGQQNPLQGLSPLTSLGQFALGQSQSTPYQQSLNPFQQQQQQQQQSNPYQSPYLQQNSPYQSSRQQPLNSLLRNSYGGQQPQTSIHSGNNPYGNRQSASPALRLQDQAGNTVTVPPSKTRKHKKTD